MRSHASDLILRVQTQALALIAELPVEPLDEGTLDGLPGLNDLPLDPRAYAH